MNLIRAVRQSIERRMSITDFDSVLDMLSGGGAPSYTGKLVSTRTSLAVAMCWACINVLADDFATCPLKVYRWIEPGKSKDEARDHYLWPLFQEEANPHMSAFRFKKVMETWRQLWGNAYAEIELNGRGQVVAYWPWRPDRVAVWQEDPNDPRSRLLYSYIPVDKSKPPITVPADRILHIRGTSMDGFTGLSPIEVHRQKFGIDLAMTEHAGRFFGNGAVVKGMITVPQLGTKNEASILEWLKQYQGVGNSWRTMVLKEGMDYKPIEMKMADAQFVEMSGMNDRTIAQIYKVPQHRVGLLNDAAKANMQQLGIEYVQYTLGPNVENWCGEIHNSSLTVRERQSVFVSADYAYLMVADSASRAQLYQACSQGSAFAPDDIRHREGLNPLPNGLGALPRVPLNTADIESDEAKGIAPPGLKQVSSPDDPNDPTDSSVDPTQKPNTTPAPSKKQKRKRKRDKTKSFLLPATVSIDHPLLNRGGSGTLKVS